MNVIVSTMKIHNHLIVSTIQIINKPLLHDNSDNNNNSVNNNSVNNNSVNNSVNVNYNNSDYCCDDDYDYLSNDDNYSECMEYDDYSESMEYDNCGNCNRLILNTLLNYGLCETCLFKHKRKLKIYNKKMSKK